MDAKRKKQRQPSPYCSANSLSRITFTWMWPVFLSLYRQQRRTADDLFENRDEDDSKYLGDRLHIEWEKECLQSQAQKRKTSFLRALARCFRREAVTCAILVSFLTLVLRFLTPVFLMWMVRYFSGEEGYSRTMAWMCAVGIAVVSFLSAIIQNVYYIWVEEIALQARVAVCSLIYRKIMRVSLSSMGNEIPIGQIVNLLSNDTMRFCKMFIYLCYLWIGPIQVIIATGVLWSEFGPSAFAGMLTFVITVPFQSFVGAMFTKLQLRTVVLTDRRVHVTRELMTTMQAIKMFTWEPLFIDMLETARKNEVGMLKKLSYLRAMVGLGVSWVSKGFVFMCCVTYLYMGNFLQPDKVFFVMSLMNNLQREISVFFPVSMVAMADTYVTCQRLQRILEMKERVTVKAITHISEPRPLPQECGLVVYRVSARWSDTTLRNTLNNVSCSVFAGDLLTIAGPVGSGKSTLLKVILGELPLVSGRVLVQGKMAYLSQESWIVQGTVRDNILFGQPFKEERYLSVINVCALRPDLKLFPRGDLTLVGENGAALSGGQKARISLARAVYSDADIYLLDDPLSAVDAHVGRYIFEHCIMKYLGSKVRVLVTHQVQFVKATSNKLFLKQDHLENHGGSQEMMSKSGDLASAEAKSGNAESQQNEDVNAAEGDLKRDVMSAEERKKAAMSQSNDDLLQNENGKDVLKDEKALGVEKMASGRVPLKVLWRFFRYGHSSSVLLFCASLVIIIQIANSGVNLFLSQWTNGEQIRAQIYANLSVDNPNITGNDVPTPEGYLDTDTSFYIYTGLILLYMISFIIGYIVWYSVFLNCSHKTHNAMVGALIRAPMKYFETHPLGQILNRFSKDIGEVDENFRQMLVDGSNMFMNALGALALVVVVSVWLMFPSLILLGFLLLMIRALVPVFGRIKRLEAVERSPLVNHLNTSMTGLISVRAFGAQQAFIQQFYEFQNRHTPVWFLFISMRRWMSMFIDIITSTYSTVVVFSVMGFSSSLAGDVGLAITSATSITVFMSMCMWNILEILTQLTSVERLIEYCDLEPEAPWEIKETTPRPEWPQHGVIAFDKVSLNYDPDEPPVLNNLTFYVRAGEKIGIVGRTGAGKSSMVSSLFRLAEPRGSIRIDGVDIGGLGLHVLRSRLSIIPQDPTVLSGSFRKNLDPTNQKSDEAAWKILEEVQLSDAVRDMQGGLDARLTDGGSNLSVGQRQLLCLGRALLKDNKILILDEASANIDHKLDEKIQEIIRTKFKRCTVLTIAHRLQTIMDCDRVMVLRAGQLVEFDEPHILLRDKASSFSSLVDESSPSTALQLRLIAEHAYRKKRGILESVKEELVD